MSAAKNEAPVRRRLIAKVHVAKKALGIDDDVYRAILERITGARSAADLTEAQLVAVLEECQRLGWTPPVRAKAAPTRISGTAHVRKVWALWREMGEQKVVNATRPALRAFVLKMTGVSDPEWLSVKQTNAVIEGLKAWQRRAIGRVS